VVALVVVAMGGGGSVSDRGRRRITEGRTLVEGGAEQWQRGLPHVVVRQAARASGPSVRLPRLRVLRGLCAAWEVVVNGDGADARVALAVHVRIEACAHRAAWLRTAQSVGGVADGTTALGRKGGLDRRAVEGARDGLTRLGQVL
jgi:hypothetical protein